MDKTKSIIIFYDEKFYEVLTQHGKFYWNTACSLVDTLPVAALTAFLSHKHS